MQPLTATTPWGPELEQLTDWLERGEPVPWPR